MNSRTSSRTLQLVWAAVCLALALVLPFLTGNIPEIGSKLCPMHLPVLLCGFLCGPVWGMVVGFVAPLLRSVMFHMPPFPQVAVPMAFELLTYGGIAGLCYKLLPKKKVFLWVDLVIAMIAGRIVGVLAKLVCVGILGMKGNIAAAALFTSYVTDTIPGIIVQIILIPLIIIALKKARLIPAEPAEKK
ncbi:MAG: ECF transporter S component [Lachnospiraceae bacterium]|nr:ECF transporter S component [Lachnospiraceae bacterium]